MILLSPCTPTPLTTHPPWMSWACGDLGRILLRGSEPKTYRKDNSLVFSLIKSNEAFSPREASSLIPLSFPSCLSSHGQSAQAWQLKMSHSEDMAPWAAGWVWAQSPPSPLRMQLSLVCSPNVGGCECNRQRCTTQLCGHTHRALEEWVRDM